MGFGNMTCSYTGQWTIYLNSIFIFPINKLLYYLTWPMRYHQPNMYLINDCYFLFSFQKSGQRMKCSACQLIAHQNCIPYVNEKTQLACKPTYRDVGVRQYREQSVTHHHWVHRKMEKGKCKQCGKVSDFNMHSLLI